MKSRKRERRIIVALAAVLAAVFIVSFSIGRYPVSVKELAGIVLSRFVDIEQFWTDSMVKVLYNIRLPRVLLACMVGCCLSVAGAVFQGVFRNPMASPQVLGASKGASFGACLAILLGLSSMQITLSAFVFGMLSILIVMFFGRRVKGNAAMGLILAGIMVGSLFEAGVSFMKITADPTNELPAMTYWLVGSLSGATMKDVAFIAVPMAIGLIPLFLLRWRLNMLTMDEDEARTLGVNTRRLRLAALCCATLITASCVAVSGLISWVGLVMPHVARKLTGSDYRYMISTSALTGAVFLLIVDNISRSLLRTEIPIGILTAFVGAPFFLYLLSGRGERRR